MLLRWGCAMRGTERGYAGTARGHAGMRGFVGTDRGYAGTGARAAQHAADLPQRPSTSCRRRYLPTRLLGPVCYLLCHRRYRRTVPPMLCLVSTYGAWYAQSGTDVQRGASRRLGRGFTARWVSTYQHPTAPILSCSELSSSNMFHQPLPYPTPRTQTQVRPAVLRLRLLGVECAMYRVSRVALGALRCSPPLASLPI
eukprot:2144211-Rhodomonas_salina.1